MALGKRLKEARKAAGLSQSDLAELVGMTQAAVGALETRDSRQSSKAVELARALGVRLEWLISGEGEMRPSEARGSNFGYRAVDPANENFELEPPTPIMAAEIREDFIVKSLSNPVERRRPSGMKDMFDDELEFFGHMDAWDSNTPLDEDEVELPLFREVELAAGAGQTQVIENHGAKLRFAKSTLSRAGVVEENAACAFVRGNSMEPVMPDGTCVGVNTGDTAIRDGEIYAIDHDGMLRVKYLHRRPGGGIKIVSQNATEHATEEYSAQDVIDNNIRIIGRVFWWSVLR